MTYETDLYIIYGRIKRRQKKEIETNDADTRACVYECSHLHMVLLKAVGGD